MIDRRVGLKPTSNFKIYDKCSPKVVSVHPIQTNLFLAPSNKGGCGIYDIRKPASKNSLMKPLTQLTGHSKAISSAFFSNKTGSRVVTVAYDNKIRLYDTSDDNLKSGMLKPYKSITHNNQTGRWLTTFKVRTSVFLFKVCDFCLVHVIWTARRITNLGLNVCFDIFS